MEGHAREMAFLQLKLHEKTQDEQGFDSLMSEQATHHSVATLEFCFENSRTGHRGKAHLVPLKQVLARDGFGL